MKLPLLGWWRRSATGAGAHSLQRTTVQHSPHHITAGALPLGVTRVRFSLPEGQCKHEKEVVARLNEEETIQFARAEAEVVEIDLSATPVHDTAKSAHHHDCSDRDAWLAEHAYLARLRATADPTKGDSACTTSTIAARSLSSSRRQIDDAPPY